ncbi:hypothetical protein Ahy_B08g092173 [Arachis hypogaea]|uniref:NADH-ubiquinone oxidoreductase chain 3 n=1 Tax=Arachis hypogaea TaxID=3818 RepID=A0A444Y3C5_ARAHY|nr:hypothetical protein Ahy_B08g092173 [Arachis hypogaea]
MFLLYDYDICWAFLIISSLIPILTFLISEILAPISKGLEKLFSYEAQGDFTCWRPLGGLWTFVSLSSFR